MVLRLTAPTHVPVMVSEVLDALAVQPGGRYIDCTLGEGGHAVAILESSAPGGQLLGIDADPKAIELAKARLRAYSKAAALVNDNFVNLEAICHRVEFYPVHGILFDLGLSSLQLADASRGFSFQVDAPLDMRVSPDQDVTAADLINSLPEDELAQLVFDFGEEPRARRVARNIVDHRPLHTTLELARVAEQALGGRMGRIHPATRTFQALRIAVNHELVNLDQALRQTIDLLGYGGRLVVISYHSLEDRLVKNFMRREASGCLCPPEVPHCVCGHAPQLRLVTRKPVRPSLSEVQSNPRSRSAKLRVAERI